MNVDLRFPNITATSAEGQIAQMQSYVHQLVQQLNWAFNTIEDGKSGNTSNIVMNNSSEDTSPKEAEDTFNSIKALIIKSADIVKAYEETIYSDFKGEYFADSDFGTYIEETSRNVVENSKYVQDTFTMVQTISGKVDGIEDDVRTTNAYIRKGFLGNDKETGEAAYGIAVGETDNNGVYRQYAWFTADKLTFFDETGYPVAYIGNGTLRVAGKSQFDGEIRFGGYNLDTSDGMAFTWVG